MLARRPVPSWTSSSSGLAARANRRTVLRDRPSAAAISPKLRPVGQHPVHVGVPARVRSAILPVRGTAGAAAASGAVAAAGRGLRCDRCRQVLPVPGNRALYRLAEVVPQVPSVGYLHRVRRAAGAAVGIEPCPVPADELRARAGGEPYRERLR